MTFPSNVDADPDPTTQIPWPARMPNRRRASTINHPGSIAGSSALNDEAADTNKASSTPKEGEVLKRRMSTMDLVKLSISMAGAQVAWTVELGYVGISVISETFTDLSEIDTVHRSYCRSVSLSSSPAWCGWLVLSAGWSRNQSSVCTRTVVLWSVAHYLPSGAISDASKSKYRRRYWVVLSTVALVLSTFTLAYCQPIAAFLVDLFGGGKGSWDPQWTKDVRPCAWPVTRV